MTDTPKFSDHRGEQFILTSFYLCGIHHPDLVEKLDQVINAPDAKKRLHNVFWSPSLPGAIDLLAGMKGHHPAKDWAGFLKALTFEAQGMDADLASPEKWVRDKAMGEHITVLDTCLYIMRKMNISEARYNQAA